MNKDNNSYNEIESLINYYQELDAIANGTFIYDKDSVPFDETFIYNHKEDYALYLSNIILYLNDPLSSNMQKYLSITQNINFENEEDIKENLRDFNDIANDPLMIFQAYNIRFLFLAGRISENHPRLDLVSSDLLIGLVSGMMITNYLKNNIDKNKQYLYFEGYLSEATKDYLNELVEDLDEDDEYCIKCILQYKKKLFSYVFSLINDFNNEKEQELLCFMKAITYIIKLDFDKYKEFLHEKEYDMFDYYYQKLNIIEEDSKAILKNHLPNCITREILIQKTENLYPASDDEWFGYIDEFFDDYSKINQLAKRLYENGHIDESSIATFILRFSGKKSTDDIVDVIKWKGDPNTLYFIYWLFQGGYRYRVNWEPLKKYFIGPDYIRPNVNRKTPHSAVPILKEIFGLKCYYSETGNLILDNPKEVIGEKTKRR